MTTARDVLYRLAYLATADHDIADSHVREVLRNNPGRDTDALVEKLVDQFAEELHEYPRADWVKWDGTLRVQATTADGLDEFMRHRHAWELKRVCLAQALGSIRPSARLAFIYVDIYGASIERAAKVIQISEQALQLRVTRARQDVRNCLEPMCQHVGRNNPCTCSGRVGLALRMKLIPDLPSFPTPGFSHISRPTEDVEKLYRHLPIAAPSEP